MAAYTDTLGFYKGTAAYGAHADKRLGWLEVELDFEKIVAARAAAGATALAAADTLQVLQLPAYTQVLAGGMEVLETDASTATFDVGFTGGSPAAANVFANDAAIATAAVTSVALAAPVSIGSSADTIDILINTAAPTTGRIRVFALVLNLN